MKNGARLETLRRLGGVLPLCRAADTDNIGVIGALLDKGANIEGSKTGCSNDYGAFSPLSLAAPR
ncbi:MAG TPA: hypothetical protein VNK24_10560 [Elusimicrobiota bacterium]|nr:hypothetical protein [Elusimicrobiota bacterium]